MSYTRFIAESLFMLSAEIYQIKICRIWVNYISEDAAHIYDFI